MGTRGLVIIKLKGVPKAYYNQFDSYPSVLMKELSDKLTHLQFYTKETVAEAIGKFVESRSGHNIGMKSWIVPLPIIKRNNTGIDYLYHEYIYFIDLDKMYWQAFESIWDENDTKPPGEWNTHKGHLKPLSGKLNLFEEVNIEEKEGLEETTYVITQELPYTVVKEHPRTTKRVRTRVKRHIRRKGK